MPKEKKDRPILVPVDFSTYSEAALLCAADLADMINEPLIVLHVVHDPGEAPGYYAVKGRKKQLHRLEDVAAEMLQEFVDNVKNKNPHNKAIKTAQTELVTGLPVNRILEVAEHSHARMIVMGSQGRTGLSHVLLGSIAERVVHLSPIPVTIVKNKHKK
jgi:nucleotide-binding universal stress UspA family protein